MQTDYTQSARKALKLAERAAKACHHSYVGSEHLLLGLVQEPDGTAGVILRNHKVEGKKLSELIAKLVAPGSDRALTGGGLVAAGTGDSARRRRAGTFF